MPTKVAPPFERQDLLDQSVTGMDAFTAFQYLRRREEAPAVWAMEEKGAKKLPGTPAALGDMFNALWSDDPVVVSRDQVPPSRQYWRGLLEETVKTDPFQALHAQTVGSSLLSFVGTVEAGSTILGLVSKEDAAKLQELDKAQEAADDAENSAAEAEAEAESLAELAAEMRAGAGQAGGSGQGQGGNGPAMPGSGDGRGQLTGAQAQALADQLAKAQAKASTTRAAADAANARAQVLADALLGQPSSAEAERKLTELKRLGMGALQKASAKVTEISKTIEGWGLEQGELDRMAQPEAFALLEKMRRTKAFEQFAKLLGRLRAIAAKKAANPTEGEGRRVTRRETGRDISRAYTSELVALAHPATRMQALQRWARGELSLRGQEAKKPLGHGPVVVCEDASGSMDGVKQQWAKGVVLALAHFAKLKGRSFGWIMFDSVVQRHKVFPKGMLGARDLLEIAESRSCGGTDFERPLRKAVEMIERDGLKKADIAFITDGECAVSGELLQWLAGKKKSLEFNIVGVMCDSGDHVSDATLKSFCDRIERATAFSAEEAEAKVFAHI